MKKLLVAAVATVMFLGVQAYGEVKSVNVVGVMGLEIAGGAENTFTLLAAPMTKLPVARGLITANTDSTITDGNAAWAATSFAVGGAAADEPGNSTYYVEITSGVFEGRHFYIASNDSMTLTLANAMGDIAATDLEGAGYKIIAANRIRDIFGEPGAEMLAGGSSAANADLIYMISPGGWAAPVFYRNSGLGQPMDAWAQSGDAVNDLVVDRDVGVLVMRRAGGDTVQLAVTGEVSANAQAVVVEPGFAMLGGMSAVSLPIGQTTMTTVMAGGSSAANADALYEWTGTGWSAPVFYRNQGLGEPINTWVQSGVDVAETFLIEAGKAYFIRKGGTSADVWDRESPLSD